MSTAIATQPERRSLVQKFADKFSIEPTRLLATLKATAFKQRGDMQVSNEQMAALLVVADQYGLNPFTKEIYAFEDKGSIVPVVSVDGWSRIINSHPELDGIEFDYSESIVTPTGGKPCPEWCEIRIYRKDRARPVVVREYLDEVYREPFKARGKDYTISGPWQTHTKRFLRHKTLIQGARIAFGFSGIYDQDEGERIIEAETVRVQRVEREDLAELQERLQQRAALDHQAEPAQEAQPEPETVDESRPAADPVPEVDPETGEVIPPEVQ
ncbi:recombinase RecT [Lysobacter sp. GX 14042]|uniref:recombinase RecT n=1 Tax=Lysobacter sp. GX 14042 TaxID=2907155 RepID=UPI0031BA8875